MAERWTDEQAAALTARGHALLTASAGTGKTTTVVGKILWHLGLPVGARADGSPIPPCPDPCGLESIAAITFTEKAAYDLKRKLREELEATEAGRALRWEVDRASVGTIHAFSAELLRDHALRLDIEPTFRVLDERETRLRQDEILRDLLMERLRERDRGTVELVKRFGLYGWEHSDGAVDQVRCALRDLRWRASRYRAWRDDSGEALDSEALERLARDSGAWAGGNGAGGDGAAGDGTAADRDALARAGVLHDLAREAAHRWLSWLERENVRDFDSLVLDVRRLLTRPETRPALESIRRRYRLLVIDEFQDTDAAQRDIAFAIGGLPTDGEPRASAAEGGPQLFLVGDAKQSIYRFRGADITVWNSVRETLCGDEEPLQLTHNFRSEPAVIRLVNRVGSRAMEERAAALAGEAPESRVPYRALEPFRPPGPAGGVEWLVVDEELRAEERREAEGRRVAARIRELVDGGVPVEDPEDGRLRPCRYGDVAVLARKGKSLTAVEAALREYEIPSYDTATAGLSGRQEVVDLVTVLRLLCDPYDDLRAFGYLRSPFVGLRDEVLARIRLDPDTGGGSLLGQARRWLEAVEAGEAEPFPAPESERVAEVEHEALARGLEALDDARALADRAPHAELLEGVLRDTGYRLHLLLRDGARETVANLERFLALLEDYRHLPLGAFLDLWDRWGEQDLGIPQAPLYSAADDVVTLSTIHGAKGLEWPIVCLVSLQEGPGDSTRRLVNSYWSDPDLGPVLMPKSGERGPRCERLLRRAILEDDAEEARLLYVAATRARDRLILVGDPDEEGGYAGWLAAALEDAVEARDLDEAAAGAAADGPASRGPGPPLAADEVTGTGPQIDAFGFHDEAEDENGQYSLFAAREASAAETDAEPERVERDVPPVVLRRGTSSVQTRLREPPVALSWLEGLEAAEPPPLVRPVDVGRRSFVTSATELRMRDRAPEEWELRYVHGVEPVWRFAPRGEGEEDGLPATVRGQVIHGVLERIEAEAEMARLLEETLSGIDEADVEELLQPGNRYREALEREIRSVVRSPEWAWYVSPPHDPERHRELSFVHLAGPEEWRVGAFDLYRPALRDDSGGRDGGGDREGGPTPSEDEATAPGLFDGPPEEAANHDGATWIVDFKTHLIEAAAAERTAREYAVQVRVYREAAEAVLGRATAGDVRVALHFTRPNVAVEA